MSMLAEGKELVKRDPVWLKTEGMVENWGDRKNTDKNPPVFQSPP